MKPIQFLFILFLAINISCGNSAEQANAASAPEVTGQNDFKYWTWITANAQKSDDEYRTDFRKYKDHGIDAVLIDTKTDPEVLKRFVPLAKEAGLELHAWMFTMNRPGDPVAQEHPEWYAVSRNGRSTFDDPPYVDYYKWLCPTREESRNHVLSLVEGLAKVEGVESVHLDYIRFSDIFLPIGLLPKYNLEQEEELAEFDFCYCEVCIAEFEKEHHKNPKDFENPALDMEWKQFRLNRVKDVVDAAYSIAHANGKQLTAAVFPYPEMADHMVRQRWDKWKIDAVLPMVYHEFYNEELDWIGFVTRQGVKDLEGKNTSLHTGIFLPNMTGEEVAEAIKLAKENGAGGVSFFDGNALNDEHLQAIKNSKK